MTATGVSRRKFLGGVVALAAPAVIRTPGLLMPVHAPPASPSMPLTPEDYAERTLLLMLEGTGYFAAACAAFEDKLAFGSGGVVFDARAGLYRSTGPLLHRGRPQA